MKLFASQDPLSYSLYFDLNIWFRTRKVTGTFEKRAQGQGTFCIASLQRMVVFMEEQVFEPSVRYTFLATLSYYFWSTIEQIATVMGNITGNEVRYRKILANTNSPVVPSMRKCFFPLFQSLQTKFRSTVAHICNHNKQFLKHTDIFLEHK